MDDNNYKTDGQLYMLYTKNENRLNDKINSDGSIYVYQKDIRNKFDEPVKAIPISISDNSKNIEADDDYKDKIREQQIEICSMIIQIAAKWGYHKIKEVVVPKIKGTIKKHKNIKAQEILKKQNSLSTNQTKKINVNQSKRNILSLDEFNKCFNEIQKNAILLASQINILKECIVYENNIDDEQLENLRKRMELLNNPTVINQINLILKNDNCVSIDKRTLDTLNAFRKGHFIIGEKLVPINSFI